MSTPFRFADLPAELRARVYFYMSDSDSTCLDTSSTLPNLAYVPVLRAEFLPVYVEQHAVDFDIVYHDDRADVASHLRAYDRSFTRNATEIHIYVNDDGEDFHRFADAALRIALGGRSVDWSSPSAGAARSSMVDVVFDSMRGSQPVSRQDAWNIAANSDEWWLHNTKVAREIAIFITSILVSHGPHSPLRITARELKSVIFKLDDIHGIKLNGFGENLRYRHIDAGAAAEFWAMVERE